jgi:N-acetylmuramoyl-L-alanine amidase
VDELLYIAKAMKSPIPFIIAGMFCPLLLFGQAVNIQDKLMSTGFQEGRAGGVGVDTVVLHFSSNVKADNQKPHNVDAVIKLYADANSSAHYLIARDGKVYRLVKEKNTAHHAGNGAWANRTNTLNRYSSGIELLGIGTFEEMTKIVNFSKSDYDKIQKGDLGFTAAQYTSLKALIADVRRRYPAIKNDRQHVIGHDEYAPGRKYDPGSLFDWSKIGL